MSKLVTFGLLCVAALVVASCSREDRRCIVTAASVILANWALFVLPWVYNPLSPAHLLKVIGLPATHEDMWALADLASLLTIAIQGRDTWWAPMIWSAYLATLTMHAVAWATALQYVDYSAVLDASLIVQLAVIFLMGGSGCADLVSRCRRWFHDLGSGPRLVAGISHQMVEAPR